MAEIDRDTVAAGHRGIIEMRLTDVSQLFDTLDPSPFRERDLDSKAQEYLVDSVKELSTTAPFALRIYVNHPMSSADECVVRNAIQIHFARQARLRDRDLQGLLRRGMISLCIGVTFLVVFFIIAQAVAKLMAEGGLAMLFREGMIIIGWVAMWRPLEIFLYDWWPIVGQQRLFSRLSEIPVEIITEGSAMKHCNLPGSALTPEMATALARWEGEGGHVLPLEKTA